MFPVNVLVTRFFVEIMYCSLTAVTIFCISDCLNPHDLWKTWRFLLYTLLSSYKVTRVLSLGISIIPGCTGRMYKTGDIVSYFVLVVKSLRCL